jgi:hypothetical protein
MVVSAIHTTTLTQLSRMFNELIVAKLLKKLSVFYETRVLITVFRIFIYCIML